MTDETVKTITAGAIFSWIFGIIFLLTGISIIGQGAIVIGIIIIVCSAMIIPYFNNMLAKNLKLKISGGVKFLLIIVILICLGIAMATTLKEEMKITQVDQTEIEPTTGEDSTVQEEEVQPVETQPTLNKKTEYIKNYVKLEEVEVGKGYGQFDMPGYSKEKPAVEGRIRNTGNQILDTVKITVYFLDSSGTRIGEKQYYPISAYSILGDKTPLKPNYVRDWGYVIETPPDGWAKKVEVVISDITFGEE